MACSGPQTSGDITGEFTRHSGSALPESMASLSDNGRAGRRFYGVGIRDTHPRRPTVVAGRHVIIGFQLEIYNSAPMRNDFPRPHTPISCRLNLYISQVHLRVDARFCSPEGRAAVPILKHGQGCLALPEPLYSDLAGFCKELAGWHKDFVKNSRDNSAGSRLATDAGAVWLSRWFGDVLWNVLGCDRVPGR